MSEVGAFSLFLELPACRPPGLGLDLEAGPACLVAL